MKKNETSPKKITNKETKSDNKNNIKNPDPLALSHTLMEVYTQARPVFEEAMERYKNEASSYNLDPLNINKSYVEFMEEICSDPNKLWEMQTDYWQKWSEILQQTTRKAIGEKSDDIITPSKGDRRFKSEEWQENAIFDFIKQSYLLTCNWMKDSVYNSQGLSKEQKEKLALHTRIFTNAMSPTNFIMTNPEVLKETINTGGENLINGLQNLVDDLKRGQGKLKISMTNYKAFELGKNIATTPGNVIYQNDLIQLIQYKPTTKKVFKKPLLIVSPWINKYYILDLRPDNSLIKWAVDHGHTVFTISWVNPTAELAQNRFEDYMSKGILNSLEQIEKITGETQTNVIGYCLGGTLLATTLAYLEATGNANKVASATFLTTLLDFEHSGEIKLFLDDEQLELLDRIMAETGIFEGKQLQQTFSLLRSNDLIWSFVVNNYLMGKEPFPFDLLYWNDDSTNMPAAMHSFYLRKMYRDNLLTKPGGVTMNKIPIDISKIKTPAYFLSTREDHIAPWKATYEGTQMINGEATFTLAASGHIAGIVNPPNKKKYCYWTSKETPSNPDKWMENAKEHDGSWWPHWQEWIKDFGGTKIEAREIKNPIEPAPGSYVRVKSN
ncbi:MAG: class I poly(R)-hydroxyalkanoic acid synthase [Alphaproteobacteria bacterium]|nr:class I poly(R)-hydroxyalkanoic acid synthase [Alphaproteobacteria bacterium]